MTPLPAARSSLSIASTPRATRWFVLCSVVAVLYLARSFLIPIALAVFLAFILAPLVQRLARTGLHRVAATALTMAMVALPVSAIGWMLASQVRGVGERLPEYRANLISKAADVRSAIDRPFEQATATIRELGNELASSTEASEPAPESALAPASLPATIPGDGATWATLQAVLQSTVGFSGFAALVLLLAFVMLLRWDDLRDRLLAMAGEGALPATSRAAQEASLKISGYLRRQLLVNVMHGATMGLLLWWIGVPTPLVWGILGAALRFVPYLGPIVANVAPILFSFASSDGWSQTLVTMGALLTLEIVTNNVVEPWIYGAYTGISTVALLVSAAFWIWIWGPLGLVLATPLSVCLLVVGKHFPSLRFLNLLFGDEPAMSPRTRLYHRLVAGDPDGAWEILRAEVAQSSLVEAADRTLLPALGMAAAAGGLILADTESRERAGALAHGLVDELDDLPQPASIILPIEAARVLCLPARDAFDAVGSRILARELARRNLQVTSSGPELLLAEVLETIRRGEVDLVVISSVVPTQFLQVRALCKRLLALESRIDILVGLWGEEAPAGELMQKLPGSPQVHVATTLAQAIAWSEEVAPRVASQRALRAAELAGPALVGVAQVPSEERARPRVTGIPA